MELGVISGTPPRIAKFRNKLKRKIIYPVRPSDLRGIDVTANMCGQNDQIPWRR